MGKLPVRGPAIVFSDGKFERALAGAKSDKIPAKHGYRRWGSGNMQQFRRENEKWAKLKQVHIERIKEPGGGMAAGGSMGGVILTPTNGHTLLEMFILTGAGFELVDSEKAEQAK